MQLFDLIRSLKKVLLAAHKPSKLEFLKKKFEMVDDAFIVGEPYNLSIGNESTLEIGKNVLLRSFCSITVLAGGKLILKDGVFFNNYCSLNCIEEIIIEENSIFGEGVKIYDHNHLYKVNSGILKVERELFKTSKVYIGKNCWVGSNVTILSGVTIGDNVIIGANNLIYKSIPSNTIVKSDSKHIFDFK